MSSRPLTALALAAALAGCNGNPEMMMLPLDASSGSADLAHEITIDWKGGAPGVTPTRDHHATFAAHTAAGDFLYVLGGTDHYASYLRADILRAPLAADGSVGAWTEIGTLPFPLAGHGIALVGDFVIVTGGVTGGMKLEMASLSSKTLVAKIDAAGLLGPFVEGPPFTGGREHMSLLAQDRFVYLIGGLVGADGTTQVSRTTVAMDGTLSPWTPMTALPTKRSHHASAIADGALYVTGGISGGPQFGSSLDDVLRAPILMDGTLGPWTEVAKLPAPLSVHSANFHLGALYLFGGLENDADFIPTVRRATVHSDGTLGPWNELPPLHAARGHVLETPILNGYVYSVGGSIADLTCIPDVEVGHYQ